MEKVIMHAVHVKSVLKVAVQFSWQMTSEGAAAA